MDLVLTGRMPGRKQGTNSVKETDGSKACSMLARRKVWPGVSKSTPATSWPKVWEQQSGGTTWSEGFLQSWKEVRLGGGRQIVYSTSLSAGVYESPNGPLRRLPWVTECCQSSWPQNWISAALFRSLLFVWFRGHSGQCPRALRNIVGARV